MPSVCRRAGRGLSLGGHATGLRQQNPGRARLLIRGFAAVRRAGRNLSSPTACLTTCLALAVGGCSNDTGYVEIRTGPPTLGAPPLLYLDAVKIEPHNGTVVLREHVGTAKLRIGAGGQLLLLCEVVVKKNRITTVTVSLIDRPPRCQCRTDVTAEQRGGRVCIG